MPASPFEIFVGPNQTPSAQVLLQDPSGGGAIGGTAIFDTGAAYTLASDKLFSSLFSGAALPPKHISTAGGGTAHTKPGRELLFTLTLSRGSTKFDVSFRAPVWPHLGIHPGHNMDLLIGCDLLRMIKLAFIGSNSKMVAVRSSRLLVYPAKDWAEIQRP